MQYLLAISSRAKVYELNKLHFRKGENFCTKPDKPLKYSNACNNFEAKIQFHLNYFQNQGHF